MKKILLFSFVLMNWLNINAQPCSNQNLFLTENLPDGLSEVADHIDLSSGIVILNSARWLESGGVESIKEILALDNNISFEQKMETTIRGKKYVQYQQFYKGIKVEDGGFTITYITTTNPDDCLEAYFLSLGIVDKLEDVKTETLVSNNGIRNILESHTVNTITYPLLDAVVNPEIIDAVNVELLISNVGTDNCANRLVWKANYNQEGAKTSWVDARSGQVLNIANSFFRLTAPIETEAYADDDLSNTDNNIFRVNLDDSTIGGTTSLISADGRVRTHDFGANLPATGTTAAYATALIPTTTANEWTIEATTHVFQTHHIATQVLPVLDDIGIEFGTINIGANTGENAASFWTSSTATAFVFMGEYGGSSTALYDVLAHELGHAHLFDFIPGSPAIGRNTLQEAIADLIGTYVESVVQGEVDWQIGDDEENVYNEAGRDLANISETCFDDDIDGLTDQYERGDPLRHLFYLLSEGQDASIPALGIERTLTLILDGVYMLGTGVIDYDLLRTATLAQARLNFEECSVEELALYRAWSEICVDGIDIPCYSIGGKKQFVKKMTTCTFV